MNKEKRFSELVTPARGVIFDFDGVLADSEKHHFLSYREVFARYGHNVDENEYYKHWTSLGEGARGEIARYALDLDPDSITREKRPIYSNYCRDGSIKLYREAREIIRILKASAKKLAIASGSHCEDIIAILENEEMGQEFSVIVGKDEVRKTKPHPEVLLKALEAMKLKSHECVVIEDAEKGMYAATKARIPVIVARSSETHSFEFPKANLVLDSLQEFLDLLRQIF